MRWLDVRKLKALRNFPVPPEILAAGRVKLVALVEASPMPRRTSAWFMSTAWRPVMAAMVVIVVATGGGTVAAAHDALPGDRLYVVKLAAEDFRERAALTPERRFVIQAAHAARRLEETERLIARQGLVAHERVTRVRAAMDLFEDHVFAMNEIAVRFEADPEKPEKGMKALSAAERVIDRHVDLIASATQASPYMASLMLEPIGGTFSLEADVYAAIPADDGGEDERARRGRERAERVGDSLKRVRAEFDARRNRRDGGDDDLPEAVYDGAWEDEREGRDRDEDESRDGIRFEAPLEIRLGM
jgi:hypothetical protein